MRVHGDIVTAPVQFVHVRVEHHLMAGCLDWKHSQDVRARGHANRHESEQRDFRTFRKSHLERHCRLPEIRYYNSDHVGQTKTVLTLRMTTTINIAIAITRTISLHDNYYRTNAQ